MSELSKPATISDIDVSLVDVAAGRRRLDPKWVETLADLFASQGQMTPIEVIDAEGRFKLVFGRHRLAAAKQNGWDRIAAVVKTAADFSGEADIVLREITENLARRELSALDKSVDIARWREIYEANHLIAKPGRKARPVDGAELTAKFAVNFSVAARRHSASPSGASSTRSRSRRSCRKIDATASGLGASGLDKKIPADQVATLSAEDREVMKMMGLSEEDYRKANGLAAA